LNGDHDIALQFVVSVMDIAKKCRSLSSGSLWSHPKNEVVFFLFLRGARDFYDRAIVVGTLLSKPRMSFIGVDLFSAPAGEEQWPDPQFLLFLPAPPAPKAIKVPKVFGASAPRGRRRASRPRHDPDAGQA